MPNDKNNDKSRLPNDNKL